MTKVIQILGTPANYKFNGTLVPSPTDVSRIESGKRTALPPKKYYNTYLRTDGEFAMQLLLDELLIKKAGFGDTENIYTVGENWVYNALKSGLHTGLGVGSFGTVPKELRGVANAIRSAKKMTTRRSRPVSRVAGPFDPYGDDPIVSLDLVCGDLQNQVDFLKNQISQAITGGAPLSIINSLRSQLTPIENELFACNSNTSAINILNDGLEESAHDFMYAYLSNSDINTNATSIVSSKSGYQNIAIAKLGQIIDVSNANMRSWVQNGIMRQNIVNGGDPLEGRLSALAVAYDYQKSNGIIQGRIGEPITIAALIAIGKTVVAVLGALTAAIYAATKLVEAFSNQQQQNLTNNIPPPGSEVFNPYGPDWEGGPPLTQVQGGSNNAPNDNNNGLLLGLAAAAAFLAFGNK